MYNLDIIDKKQNTITAPYLEIEGGFPLEGKVQIPGAKNAALPAIVAACLSKDTVVLHNVPVNLNDMKLLIQLLRDGGASVIYNKLDDTLVCNGSNWNGGELDSDICSKIRHSLLLLGLSSSWKKEIFIPMPGGCDLGNRKHDMHIDALTALGDGISEEDGIKLYPGNCSKELSIEFYYPTFGGTLNAIFSSVTKNNSQITIHNAAKNPEVIDVIELLKKMGANIEWTGEKTLRIIGVSDLKGTDHLVMPDRIIGATVIAATAITNGNVLLENFDRDLLFSEIEVWTKSNIKFSQEDNGLRIQAKKNDLKPSDITTRAYPGFHTDIQPLHTLLMTFAKGNSKIKETILDGRFKYCNELNKMGAKISVEDGDFICVNGAQGQIAKVDGVNELEGTLVKATDIRGGAAVAVAALAAKGITTVTNIYQLERGYDNFVEMYNSLGAKVKRVE
ncbi:UDP-N-acetylglucosamine 1-carboxyvinyltransferase [Shouchella miscanthi]|uniref:UDP-N-acetylglucosamine 1-carboxyvinyltransferase n=1 Tax=Shouchella miscanthi TaxID=2598861 RepID=UPI00119F61B1|nr:UDP-N-acetylglucosamine 1-carboxyvinyltransferase [Shouchella miscanthi]